MIDLVCVESFKLNKQKRSNYMKLNFVIQKAIEKCGVEIIKDLRIVNILDDANCFNDLPVAKIILREIIRHGYGEKVYSLFTTKDSSMDFKIRTYVSEMVNNYGFREDITSMLFDEICLSLNILSYTLSTSVSEEELGNAVVDEYGVRYSPDGRKLLICPENLDYIKIKESTEIICDNAFSSCVPTQNTIVIPNNVKSIGKEAFSGCALTAKIILPNSVITIGDYAFARCGSLKEITIPNSVKSIGMGAFNFCSCKIINESPYFKFIEDILYTADMKTLLHCYNNKTLKQKKIIPNGVTTIGDDAFYGCTSLENITIPNSVTSIGSNAFLGCKSLLSITIPDGVTKIGDYTFYGCTSLHSITIPDSVTKIGDGAFRECASLHSITIPKGVTNIADDVFYECKSLENITIPDSVISIGKRSFFDCASLQLITIPNNVSSIGTGAFSKCSCSIICKSPHYKVVDDILYTADMKTLLYCNKIKDGLWLPSSVTCIQEYAFYNLYKPLTRIVIPDSVTSIGDYAFSKCHVTGIHMQKNVTSIGQDAFSHCVFRFFGSLEGLSAIPGSAFWGCINLRSITIPSNIKRIGWGAFYGCKLLSRITFLGEVAEIKENAFGRCTSLNEINIPKGTRAKFEKMLPEYKDKLVEQ